MIPALVERVVRSERTRVLGSLLRLGGDLDLAEEALQEASARALERWAVDGPPERPGAWLLVVGRRWMLDQMRSASRLDTSDGHALAAPEQAPDDRLRWLFACCSTELSERARVALALRSLLGLRTAEIARALLEKESTTAQRLVRAKRLLLERAPLPVPSGEARGEAIRAVLRTLYLAFNEGFVASDGARLSRPALMREAVQIAEEVSELFPFHGEALGLAALMMFHAARASAREGVDGALVPLEEQDRTRWDPAWIARGEARVSRFMALHRAGAANIGPYQLQAAIASLHCEARIAEDTDWLQIAALYRRLVEVDPSPVHELNAAVALAMSGDLAGGLAWVNALGRRGVLQGYHLLPAVKAGLLERQGHAKEARRCYLRALRLTHNAQERAHLRRCIARLET